MGFNVDGVNDNMGKHKGLSDKLGELALWLVDMVELAIKNTEFDEFLGILYFQYKNILNDEEN